MGIGTDTSAAPPPPSTPAPGPNYMMAPPPPSRRTPKGMRLTASTLLLLAAILLAVSMGVSWWGASAPGTGGAATTTTNFYPGSSFSTASAGTATTTTYSAAGLTHVGQVYTAVLGVGVLAALAGFAAMILGFMGALAVFRHRVFLRITLLLVLIAFVGAAIVPALAALAQPSAYKADVPSGGCGPSPNPCTGYWGSLSSGGVTASWGADVGWYLALAAAVLAFLALLMLMQTRRQPYTHDEVWMATPHPPMAQPPAAWSPPSQPGAAPTAPPAPGGVAPPPTAAYCPRCGNPMTFIAQYGRYYCYTERQYV